MNRSIDQLCNVIAGALALPREQVGPESSSSNLPPWTSIGHLQILIAVEAAFAIRFRTEEIPNLNSVAALAKRLELV